jgi:aryl-alcohol dehydrogenase-like predicted oxidoreductase
MLTKRVPWLKRAAQYVAAHPATGSQGEGAGRFSAKSAEESLNQSLRQLGTDYVDLLLLHECTLADANNEELLAALAGMVRAGKVRQFGLATAAANLPTDLSAIAPAHTVLQFESAALVGDQLRTMTASRRLAITHGVFRNFGALAEKVLQPAFVNAIGASEADEGLAATLNCGKTGLARLMLMDAILANENGIVLFGSTSKDNIANNLAIGSSADDWRGQLRVFRQALERLKP